MSDKKKCIIIDLEGTLSDHTHRVHFLEQKDYDKYNLNFKNDPVNKPVLDIIQSQATLLGKDIHVILLTAKSKKYDIMVRDWLEKNNIIHLIERCCFRSLLDSRSSVLVKRDWLHALQAEYEVLKAFDDRQDICEMFEAEGIKAINVGIKKKSGPAETLCDAAALYEKRNVEYGDGYKDFGAIMMGLFPDGIEIKNQKDASRFAILNIMVAKLDRYCKNFTNGGHPDSLKDISVYAAMLQEVDDELS